ncbi:hypothetical protein FBZ82_101187 [Azospirillum brasilense]|uniref:N-acetyltransferase domain-containing protein n=1 Tax=Azospirillum brasilense TaxID=192 RepID=A0A560BNI5_AZOBR|nr:GNAT family N-acetyltransferase [Azospirillum brasilense]TWA74172.1 hypothetical protein FBZ82_101187 [Azospirillum brasilense]
MVRRATSDDLPALLEHARAMYGLSGMAGIAEWSDDAMADTFHALMASPMGAVFVAEEGGRAVGMLVAGAHPLYFAHDHLVAQEIGWHAEPGYGPGLKAAFEAWAREVGASSIIMGALESQRPEAVARLYRRSGYQLMETNFIKRLA